MGRLGEGGQGVVYLGEAPGGEHVAIKVMTGGIDRSFARELAAARQVAEFCTARVIAADLDHDPPYVVSEYIDGPPLSAVAPLGGAALTRLAIGTATALTAIHRAGVVHRDFKPANVLMAPDGPRVIDFGIARLTGLTATRGGLVGTPPYMAPEQFADEPAGPAADVFAWGSTMVFAATGRPPFGGDTIAAVAYRIMRAEPDLTGLAEPLRGVVARSLAKDPAERPAARDVLLELLGEDRPGGEVDVLRRGATAAGSSRVSRRSVLLGAGAAAAAVAVTGALLWRQAVLGAPGDSPAGTATTPPPSVTPSPSAGTSRPSATETEQPPASPPPARPAALVAAVEAAVTVTSMADFSYDGGLSQSAFYGTAKGQLAYGTKGMIATDFSMRASSEGETAQVVFIETADDQATYLNGRRVTGEQDSAAFEFATMVPVTSGIGVMLDLINLTPRVSGAERVYSGSLVADTAPAVVQDKLSEITGGWTSEQLGDSQITWKLRLDAHDRPVLFDFSWRALNSNTRVTSSFTTTYGKWRTGTIQAPQ
ncbi:serine/threonine-protein kinase [Nonomuraea sp. NPDC048916]|uniref:serine/threonine-protein kinase n=1 Tax=Nonomuraea sp. NPDC048916 TaxID=3154232 RepID=UPI0033DB8010